MNDQLAPDVPSPRARRLSGDEGASLVEYALLLALIAVVCIGAVTFLGSNLDSSMSRSGSLVEAAGK